MGGRTARAIRSVFFVPKVDPAPTVDLGWVASHTKGRPASCIGKDRLQRVMQRLPPFVPSGDEISDDAEYRSPRVSGHGTPPIGELRGRGPGLSETRFAAGAQLWRRAEGAAPAVPSVSRRRRTWSWASASLGRKNSACHRAGRGADRLGSEHCGPTSHARLEPM